MIRRKHVTGMTAMITLRTDGTIEDVPSSEEEARFYRAWQPTSQATGNDLEESLRVARLVRAEPKRCWLNARKIVLKLDDYARASYVEGFAITQHGLVIEHGWVVRDGLIVEPTLLEEVLAYFPGLEFRGRAEIGAFLESPLGRAHERTPFFHAFGFAGQKSPSYALAMVEAYEHRRSLSSGGE
jgi:hypothetical protein